MRNEDGFILRNLGRQFKIFVGDKGAFHMRVEPKREQIDEEGCSPIFASLLYG